jgi:hypothetical protein
MEECFTINRLDVPPSLHRCLATTKSSRAPTLGCACEHAGSVRWRQPHGETLDGLGAAGDREKLPQRSWAIGISGPGKRSSMDRSLSPDRRWRSKMAATAATNFQRDSGHLRCSIDNASAGACGGWEHRSPPRTQSHTPSAGVVTEWYKSRFRP